jgi:hypothetical protein
LDRRQGKPPFDEASLLWSAVRRRPLFVAPGSRIGVWLVSAAPTLLKPLLPRLPDGGHQVSQYGVVGMVRTDLDHFIRGPVHRRVLL